MSKKLLLGTASLLTAISILPLFAAFEAHVINVTARIENALTVPMEHIRFGTVFPQEYLVRDLPIRLSQSFLDEPRVDDVEYFIRQKPKCVITRANGTEYNPDDPTATGHVKLNEVDVPIIDCGTAPRPLQTGETWGPLPLLCPYLSKHENSADGNEQENDGSLPAFHEPWTWQGRQLVWTDVNGRLVKSAGDTADNWIIDLAVPCFGGYCAQDWAGFVAAHNPQEAQNAEHWTQPIENEHKIFGCDLWVEVKGISEKRDTLLTDNFGTGSNLNDIPDWDETGDDTTSTTLAKSPVTGNNDSASPDGGRFAKIAPQEWICREVNAAGHHALALNYYWRGDNDANLTDDGFAEYQVGSSCDAGVFTTVATEDLNTSTSTWNALELVDLPAGLNGASFALRFRNGANTAGEHFRVDAVKVTGVAD
ncbi:MAG: hypothetical protein AAB539_03595 [Patescibacteria group bacterium]